MALTAKSLFLYGFEVTSANNAIDFRVSLGGPVLQATIPVGFYSLTSLLDEIESQMLSVSLTTITATADRTYAGGTQNRVTIATSGAYLDLLFGTGPNAAISIATLIGFTATDKTGALTYTGTSSAGTVLIPDWWGKNYTPPTLNRRNFGTVNISTSGEKEAVIFASQQFINVQFDFEPQSKALTDWPTLIAWMIKQRPFDFTPEISSPNVVYEVTLEKSTEDSKGLAFNLREMIPQYPFQFSTGAMVFRRKGVF